jgi:hypothetical protein
MNISIKLKIFDTILRQYQVDIALKHKTSLLPNDVIVNKVLPTKKMFFFQ